MILQYLIVSNLQSDTCLQHQLHYHFKEYYMTINYNTYIIISNLIY